MTESGGSPLRGPYTMEEVVEALSGLQIFAGQILSQLDEGDSIGGRGGVELLGIQIGALRTTINTVGVRGDRSL